MKPRPFTGWARVSPNGNIHGRIERDPAYVDETFGSSAGYKTIPVRVTPLPARKKRRTTK